jgi:hypothetical protein
LEKHFQVGVCDGTERLYRNDGGSAELVDAVVESRATGEWEVVTEVDDA